MSKYIYFRQYMCMFGWIVLVFDPRMQYYYKMVSLLGRGDGLGHTLKSCLTTCYIKLTVQIHHYIFTEITQPGDFVMNVKQINSQSNLTSMTSFAGPSYLTIKSSVYIILTWDSCLPNLIVYYILAKLHHCALHFNESITRTNLLQLQPSIRPVSAQVTRKYFTVERAAKTLHRMSPCTPVSVPAKITWKLCDIFSY